MSRDNCLPFERGDTYYGIGAGTAIVAADATSAAKALLGKRYMVEDPDYPALPVILQVAQYDGSGDLTADARCVDFTDANKTIFSDQAPAAAGDYALPLDHKYEGKIIRDLDLCYVVYEGPCEIEGGATVSADEPVATDTDGQVIASIAAHNYNVGFAIDAVSDSNNATVMVGRANKTGA